jgi:hypothetical protein
MIVLPATMTFQFILTPELVILHGKLNIEEHKSLEGEIQEGIIWESE